MFKKLSLRFGAVVLAALMTASTGCANGTIKETDATTEGIIDKTEEDTMKVAELKVNNLTEPMGIDTLPTFRWINEMEGYGKAQSAY
ncbi:MAG: hypothetical protein E7619_08260, partial [Ruminococcaceae bacterium]|nr:hypothetical protein [Oscillospiraceae bacterium]